ncbi:MAG: peptidoglycan editing factor PgeF [Bacillota bacterium]|nr:peptidoglycan editing factor PgeF [Bacillota bacterium]
MKTKFELIRDGRMAYLQSPLLKLSGLVDHAFSTRLGGCSKGYLASLNTAYHTGDQKENVLENRKRFFNYFGYNYLELVSSIQVHGTDIETFTGSNRGEGALPGSARSRCDGLITTEPRLVLAAYSADCLLIFFTARSKKLVALAHAGWRGTLGGITSKMVDRLSADFNLKPGELLVGLSPAICKNCYSVDEQTARQFQNKGWDDPRYLLQQENDRWSIDMTAINIRQLTKAGIPFENISGGGWCSSCSPELFYSYRRNKGETGRMIGFIAIR